MSVLEYAHWFNLLGEFVYEVMVSETLKMIKFEEGLLGRIQARSSSVAFRDYSYSY